MPGTTPAVPFRVGTAAWSIPAAAGACFDGEGSHLERYARRLCAVEINSSFYREHKADTYARWGAAVPEAFRFAVKLSRNFTHGARLRVGAGELATSLGNIRQLGPRLGVLLVQLPPSLRFDGPLVERFFQALRNCCTAPIVCEPRHRSWQAEEALRLLAAWEVGKVEADPEPCPWPSSASVVGGLLYLRLHGSPEIYKSDYGEEALAAAQARLEHAQASGHAAWCIFDNTTFGHATRNALALDARLNAASAVDAEAGMGKMRPHPAGGGSSAAHP